MSDTQPLLGEVVQVTSHDVPDSIEALQTTLPDVAEAAALVDAALTTLNDLRLEPKVLGLPLRLEFDLGYEPEASFEESITSVGESLEGIAPRLRALEAHVEPMIDSLDTLEGDLEATSSDLKAVNRSVADATLLIDEYMLAVTEAQDRVEVGRARIPRQVYVAKLAMTVVLVWVCLAQMAPLHYGWKLLTDRHIRV
jgi:hypothetical protein